MPLCMTRVNVHEGLSCSPVPALLPYNRTGSREAAHQPLHRLFLPLSCRAKVGREGMLSRPPLKGSSRFLFMSSVPARLILTVRTCAFSWRVCQWGSSESTVRWFGANRPSFPFEVYWPVTAHHLLVDPKPGDPWYPYYHL